MTENQYGTTIVEQKVMMILKCKYKKAMAEQKCEKERLGDPPDRCMCKKVMTEHKCRTKTGT